MAGFYFEVGWGDVFICLFVYFNSCKYHCSACHSEKCTPDLSWLPGGKKLTGYDGFSTHDLLVEKCCQTLNFGSPLQPLLNIQLRFAVA